MAAVAQHSKMVLCKYPSNESNYNKLYFMLKEALWRIYQYPQSQVGGCEVMHENDISACSAPNELVNSLLAQLVCSHIINYPLRLCQLILFVADAAIFMPLLQIKVYFSYVMNWFSPHFLAYDLCFPYNFNPNQSQTYLSVKNF